MTMILNIAIIITVAVFALYRKFICDVFFLILDINNKEVCDFFYVNDAD